MGIGKVWPVNQVYRTSLVVVTPNDRPKVHSPVNKIFGDVFMLLFMFTSPFYGLSVSIGGCVIMSGQISFPFSFIQSLYYYFLTYQM